MNGKIKYLFTLLFAVIFTASFVALVVCKQNAIDRIRNEKKVTVISEWKEKGKPVTALLITKKPFKVVEKITLRKDPDRENVFFNFVSESLHSSIDINDEISVFSGGRRNKVHVLEVDNEIDFDAGMYKVYFKSDKPLDMKTDWIVGEVVVEVYPDAVIVPQSAVDIVGDKKFVWKIENGAAFPVEIVCLKQNSGMMLVESGINEGEVIVAKGWTLLSGGDKVRITNKEGVKKS